jgi:hypothetical protein
VPNTEYEEIARQVASMETLGAVIRWATARSPRAEFVNVVVQDEYTHDVVVRVAADLFAVFDTT